jgi:glutathione-specific gamma-glutamylcyclotransferase
MAEADRWVFAYGSLMWRPEPTFEERRRAHLPHHRREFCVYAVHNRGTPARRGLVLGVGPRPGEHVEGVAYRVPGHRWDEAYRSLVDREQAGGAYSERWLTIGLASGRAVRALSSSRSPPARPGRAT